MSALYHSDKTSRLTSFWLVQPRQTGSLHVALAATQLEAYDEMRSMIVNNEVRQHEISNMNAS